LHFIGFSSFSTHDPTGREPDDLVIAACEFQAALFMPASQKTGQIPAIFTDAHVKTPVKRDVNRCRKAKI
jgi:hypothetical protein